MGKIYAIEPVMHDGEVFLPGDRIDADENDISAIMSAGRGTQDEDVAALAKKNYISAQKAAAEAINAQAQATTEAMAAAIAPALTAAIAQAASKSVA